MRYKARNRTDLHNSLEAEQRLYYLAHKEYWGAILRYIGAPLLKISAAANSMSIQLYEDKSKDAENSGAMVLLPNGLQITEEEQEKRNKEVSL